MLGCLREETSRKAFLPALRSKISDYVNYETFVRQAIPTVQDAVINLDLHTQPSVLRTAKIARTSKHN